MYLSEPISNVLLSIFIADASRRVEKQEIPDELARLTTKVVGTVD